MQIEDLENKYHSKKKESEECNIELEVCIFTSPYHIVVLSSSAENQEEHQGITNQRKGAYRATRPLWRRREEASNRPSDFQSQGHPTQNGR